MVLQSIKLSSGFTMPMIGLGTCLFTVGEAQKAVECAIDVGYRHVDNAMSYKNEIDVGLAIENKIKENNVKREDLFVVSKLWSTHHDPKDVRPALMQSLSNLKLDYLDLYLMHTPFSFKKSDNTFPKDDGGNLLYAEVDYVETWKAMEKLLEEGLVRSIGISNFNQYQLERLLKNCEVKPANHQFESHPYLVQDEMVQLCHKNGISVTAYSPLGSRGRPWATEKDPVLLEDPIITELAKKHSKTAAQILLRFQLQRGINSIPKSVTPSRILSNFQIFDFDLSDEDMKIIRSITTKLRVCGFKTSSSAKYYPFAENYRE